VSGRRARRLRRTLVLPVAVAAVGLAPAVAGAESFLNPSDPCPPGVTVAAAPFADRDDIVEAHRLNVDCAFALGVVEGTGGEPNRYQPLEPTRRDQMASMLVRALEAAGYTVPAAGDQGFTDIDGDVHADAINRLAALGITGGTSETTYGPDQHVRRDQMASFVVRAAEWAYGSPLEAEEGPYFADVLSSNVHTENIDTAFEVIGLAEGTTDTTFNPAGDARRDQMATFLVRLIDMVLVTE
jgi:hypothetical protein